MIVYGVDPSLSSSGIAWITDGDLTGFAKIVTPAKRPLPERLKTIYDQFCGLLDRLRPDVVVMEDQYAGKNVKTYAKLNQVRGVMVLAVAQKGIDFVTFTPTQIKRTVAGKGNASKDDIITAVKDLYPGFNRYLSSISGKIDDIADAIGIAHTYLHQSN